METPKIYETEYRFCCIIWEHEPINSGELVKLASRELGWKKSTTYTIVKRLCERGILQSKDAVVTTLYTKEQIQRQESREFLAKTFHSSLPAFLAAFAESKSLSAQDVAEIRKMIDNYEVK